MYACIHEIIQVMIMKMKNRSHIYTTKIGLSLDMDTNKVNIKSLSV